VVVAVEILNSQRDFVVILQKRLNQIPALTLQNEIDIHQPKALKNILEACRRSNPLIPGVQHFSGIKAKTIIKSLNDCKYI